MFDAAILVAGLALFELNVHALKPLHLGGLLGVFVDGHLNDVLGGLAFMGYTNLLFDLVRPHRRLSKWWVVLPYMLCCGIFWELVAPTLVRPSVTDPWDILSYEAGATVYLLLERLVGNRRPGSLAA